MSRSDAHTRRRVLVVDDSAFMRRLISDVINESDAFEVVGTARDGEHARAQILALQPDLVTLDVVMPGTDGLAVLQWIMSESPRPVVMLSGDASDGGAAATLRALELGAVDFVRKPGGPISLDLDDVRDQLLDALRAAACSNDAALLGGAGTVARAHGNDVMADSLMRVVLRTSLSTMSNGHRMAANVDPKSAVDSASHSRRPLEDVARRVPVADVPAHRVVCIAASTGGPAALTHVIPRLPRFTDTAIVIAQHLPAGFTASLAHRLNQGGRLTVREAVDQEPVMAGHAYLAPGGRHLRIEGTSGNARCVLDDAPPKWGVRPCADHLFISAAAVFGDTTLGVVLTGMGVDGADGLFAVRHAGGHGIVQDAESSIIAGMPTAALRHAGAEHVVPLDAVANTIMQEIALGTVQKAMPDAVPGTVQGTVPRTSRVPMSHAVARERL